MFGAWQKYDDQDKDLIIFAENKRRFATLVLSSTCLLAVNSLVLRVFLKPENQDENRIVQREYVLVSSAF